MTQHQTKQQSSQQQQSRFEPSQEVQAELATLNVRYRDMQKTKSFIATCEKFYYMFVHYNIMPKPITNKEREKNNQTQTKQQKRS